MPAIHFDITGDNDNIIQSLQETLDKLEQFSDVAKTLSDAGIDMTNSATAIQAVEKYIEGLEGSIEGCTDKIQELNEKIAEASEAGDNQAVEGYKQQVEELITTQDELTGVLDSAKTAVDVLNESYDATAESANKAEGAIVKLLGGQKNYNEIVSNLPGPLKSVVSGLNGMVKAAKAFIATPLGMVLTPLILGFSALYKWLNKTAEGQQVLAKMTGYLKGVMAGIQQVIFDVGKTLYNAFSNPKQAIAEFWQALKNQLLARLEGAKGVFVNFGKIIGNALKGNFKEAGEAAKAMGNDYQKIFTGKDVEQIKEGTNAFAERIRSIHNIGKAQSDLGARENKLHRERTAWLHEEAELDKQIAEQRNKMRMGTKEERSAAAAKMQELINQKTAKNVELAREEYLIKKETNALTDSSQEDLDEEERLRAKVVQLETQGVTQKGFALRIQDSMNRQLGISSEKLSELINKEQELLDGLTDKADQQGLETASLAISGMREGFDKEMAEQDLEHKQRMAAIEKEQEDRIKKIKDFQKAEYEARHNTLKGFEFDENSDLVITAKDIYGTDIENEGQRYQQALSNVYKKYTDEYRGFIGQWEELTKKFDDDRKALLTSDDLIDDPELWVELTNKEKESFENLAKTWAQSGRDEEFTRWFQSLANQSLADLQDVLTVLEVEMETLGDSIPKEELDKLRAKIVLVKKAIKENKDDEEIIEGITQDVENATVSWADLNKVLTDTAALFKEAGNAVGGMFGETLKMVGNFTTSIAKAGNAFKAFLDAKEKKNTIGMITSGITVAGAAVSVAAEVAGKIKEARERTKEVDSATKAYYRTLQQIQDSKILESFSNAFGNDTYGQFTQNIANAKKASGNITDISRTITKESKVIKNWGAALLSGPFAIAASLGTAASKGKTFTADFVSDLRTGWQKFWGSEKNIMTASMSDFFDENGNLLGDELQDWYKTYGEGLTEENKAIIEDMLAEFDRLEESKKNINSFLSGIFGDVVSDIASDMLDEFISTGGAIQDMTKYMNDFGKSVAKSIIQGKLMEQVFRDEDQKAIADLLAAGKTSEAIASFNNIMDKAKAMGPEIQAFLTEIGAQGWNDSEAQARTATSRSSLGASQESIDESNGRLTAIQAQVFQMGETVTGFKDSYDRIITNMAAMLQHTQGIHVDTTELKGIVSDMRELSRSVSRNVSQMVEKGVVMR